MGSVSLIAPLVRLLATRRVRREDAVRQRRHRRHAEESKRKEDSVAFEQAHVAERLNSAWQLLIWAWKFAQTPEAEWAFAHHGRWPILGWLELRRGGGLWKCGEAHWFGRIADKPMKTPEDLASNFTTIQLQRAVLHIERANFWGSALQLEILHRLGLMGRVV